MTTETAPAAAIQKAPRAPLAFIPANLDEAWRIADMLSKAGILPDALRGKPHDILVTVMTGTELGLSPMQSIRDIYVVKGRGYVSSLLKVALVKQSPECEFFRCVESSAKVATFATRRKGEGETRFSFTIEEAVAAGLAGRASASKEPSNWDKYPALMLRRRCSGQLADEVYPDIVRGIGDSDDVRSAEPASLNKAPETYAPPAPEMEEAQVVAPTPPPATPKQVFEQGKTAEATGVKVGDLSVEMSKQIDAHQQRVAREPGEDDDTPIQQPVSMMSKAAQPELPVEESDLAVYAQVKALCDDPACTEAQLDVLSPKAQRIKGPMRKDISDLFIAKRKALRDAKVGK